MEDPRKDAWTAAEIKEVGDIRDLVLDGTAGGSDRKQNGSQGGT